MARLPEGVADFLRGRRIAVAGVSRSGESAANPVYRKLRDCGYEVVPVNPNTSQVEGDTPTRTLRASPVTSMASSLRRIRMCRRRWRGRQLRAVSAACGFTVRLAKAASPRPPFGSAPSIVSVASSVAAPSCTVSRLTSVIGACVHGSGGGVACRGKGAPTRQGDHDPAVDAGPLDVEAVSHRLVRPEAVAHRPPSYELARLVAVFAPPRVNHAFTSS